MANSIRSKPTIEASSLVKTMLSMVEFGLVITDSYGTIVAANEIAQRLINNNNNSPKQQNIRSFIKDCGALIDQILSSKTLKNVEFEFVNKTSDASSLRINASLINDASLSGSFIAFSFITASEEALKPDNAYRSKNNFDELIGQNHLFMAAKERAQSLCTEPSMNILIMGDSGVGKTSFARAICNGTAPNASLVACNCSTLHLIDPVEYLFGSMNHGKATRGLLEIANGGTLLLGNIDELPLNLQPLFVRALDHHEIVRDMDFKIIPTKFRIIATASTKLRSCFALNNEKNDFLPELFYRIAQDEIMIPSLSQRRNDIPLLSKQILMNHRPSKHSQATTISDSALQVLTKYSWPGNIRELEIVLTSASTICRNNIITTHDLPDYVCGDNYAGQADSQSLMSNINIAQMRDKHIASVLQSTGNNVSKAAEILGIGRSTLYKYLKKRI
ncbi:sigma 54-interacting transcriptional regulator [Adlercreutzia sp. ZJ304]|uniref:sigma 54-interacting transcriptional regulator n=1 Tax=Adlercreutzia sp. ZJ304 TaxID=2709791 RepID=UPI0013EBE96A|nr:sigma 54-interacting transcriptional regulator [Adlercreutzia sp. ZJ304]